MGALSVFSVGLPGIPRGKSRGVSQAGEPLYNPAFAALMCSFCDPLRNSSHTAKQLAVPPLLQHHFVFSPPFA